VPGRANANIFGFEPDELCFLIFKTDFVFFDDAPVFVGGNSVFIKLRSSKGFSVFRKTDFDILRKENPFLKTTKTD
jgi:hypothetical protein